MSIHLSQKSFSELLERRACSAFKVEVALAAVVSGRLTRRFRARVSTEEQGVRLQLDALREAGHDDPRVQTAKRMHRDHGMRIERICQTLKISRAIFYRYPALPETPL